jgi:hypothetical protein
MKKLTCCLVLVSTLLLCLPSTSQAPNNQVSLRLSTANLTVYGTAARIYAVDRPPEWPSEYVRGYYDPLTNRRRLVVVFNLPDTARQELLSRLLGAGSPYTTPGAYYSFPNQSAEQLVVRSERLVMRSTCTGILCVSDSTVWMYINTSRTERNVS